MTHFFKQHPLIITLGTNYLSINLSPDKRETIPLNNIEIYEAGIYNPGIIAQHINNFLHKHGLKKAKAIVNVPWLKEATAKLQPFITLQVALCIASSKATLQRLISKKTDDNKNVVSSYDYLNLLKKASASSPYLWLWCTLLAILGITWGLLKKHKTLSTQEQQYRSTINALQQSTKHQEQHAAEIQQLKKETQILEIHINHRAKTRSYAHNNAQILVAIAQSIPKDTIITKLLIEQKKENKQKHQIIAINGLSKDLKSIPSFLSKLRKTDICKGLKLSSLQQQPTSQNEAPVYLFSLKGSFLD